MSAALHAAIERTYQIRGHAGVCEYVRTHHPHISFFYCTRCGADSPTIARTCLVCGDAVTTPEDCTHPDFDDCGRTCHCLQCVECGITLDTPDTPDTDDNTNNEQGI